ncbi:MAG: CPBP family intramembrane metalloprotease [Desulfobacteraceae bacterium]|nr:CPBP family intramembrane metalloprotease [Desulfobacteraceae bacterium]MBC2749884.1 CPBP family intramembrane metalloprotease [Desulfobacteraceae bacterium]
MEDETRRTSSFMLFVLLAYGAIWGLFGIGKWFAIPFSMDPRAPGGLFYLVGAALPSSCAIVAVLVFERREGLRRLMQRSLAWRFSPFWYLAAVLIPFAVTGINAMMAMLFLGASAPQHWFVPAFGPGFLLFFLVYNGLGEEIGWRGLALPVLQRHLGALGGNIAVGVIWALWHLPLFWLKGSYQYGDSILLFVLLLTCWSIIIGMLVNKSGGSILVAILFHESANFIAFTLRYPSSHYGYLVWLLAAVLAIWFLPRPYFRQSYQA